MELSIQGTGSALTGSKTGARSKSKREKKRGGEEGEETQKVKNYAKKTVRDAKQRCVKKKRGEEEKKRK